MSKSIKENSFDAAPGGYAGAISVQPSLGTYASPSTYQDPAHFEGSDYNKHYDKTTTGHPDTFTTDTSGSFDKEVDRIFKEKETPTVDDVLCGIQYELQNMIKKDKRVAKQRVLDNLKKYGAKYYTKLDMMNIDDKQMDVDPVMQERINVLNQMVADREAKKEPMRINTVIQDILREKQNQVYGRNSELYKKIQ